MGAHDAHYAGGLVDGAKMLHLFGDVATELLIKSDGDEGLFVAYDSVEFLAPVHAVITSKPRAASSAWARVRARWCSRRARSSPVQVAGQPSAADVLAEPVLVCRAGHLRGAPALPAQGPGLKRTCHGQAHHHRRADRRRSRQGTATGPAHHARRNRHRRCRMRGAGAAIVHLHGRLADGTPTQDAAVYRQIIEAVRARCDAIVQVSTGGAVGMTAAERLAPVTLAPEMATLSMGSVNFGDDVFLNAPADIEAFAKAITASGAKAELEIFDAGMMATAKRWLKKGLLAAPPHFDFVLGVPGAMPGTPEALMYLVQQLPEGATWTVAGMGPAQLTWAPWPLLGGHVRVGFEDNIFFRKGELASSNAQLVRAWPPSGDWPNGRRPPPTKRVCMLGPSVWRRATCSCPSMPRLKAMRWSAATPASAST
jgi:3-keto-5-aminohexanoate cleavage enzyme